MSGARASRSGLHRRSPVLRLHRCCTMRRATLADLFRSLSGETPVMGATASAPLAGFATSFRTRRAFPLVFLAPGLQLAVFQRAVERPQTGPGDRILCSCLPRYGEGWRAAAVLARPASVIAWQRQRIGDHKTRIILAGLSGRPPDGNVIRARTRKVFGAKAGWSGMKVFRQSTVRTRPVMRWSV